MLWTKRKSLSLSDKPRLPGLSACNLNSDPYHAKAEHTCFAVFGHNRCLIRRKSVCHLRQEMHLIVPSETMELVGFSAFGTQSGTSNAVLNADCFPNVT